jgi:hypothetical protein
MEILRATETPSEQKSQALPKPQTLVEIRNLVMVLKLKMTIQALEAKRMTQGTT